MDQRPVIKLVTVNTAPERAKILIPRVIKALESDYNLQYVDNCQAIDQVLPKALKHQPEVLLSASMWTQDEAQQIHTLAKQAVPSITTHAIPTGLQVEKGPDAIVEYLVENLPIVLSRLPRR